MNSWMTIVLVLAGVALLVGGLRFAARWAGERGWVYNKHNPRPPVAGNLGLFEEVFQPSIRHVIEERGSQRVRAEANESGDDPD